MKNLLLAITLLATSLMAFAEGKIAVIDIETALLNTERAQARMQQLQAEPDYKKNMDQVKAIQTEGKKLVEKFEKEAPTMSLQEKQKMETDIKSKQSDMEYVARKLQEAQATALKPLMYEMNSQARAVIKEIIDAEGIGLLLNGNPQLVLHADTSFDITAKVTDKLNKLNSQNKPQSKK